MTFKTVMLQLQMLPVQSAAVCACRRLSCTWFLVPDKADAQQTKQTEVTQGKNKQK